MAHHKAGRFEEAATLYRDVLALAPENIAALTYLAKIYLRQRLLDDADVLLTRALGLKPDEPRILSTIGDARQRRADFEGAIEAYRRCLVVGGNQEVPAGLDSCTFALTSLRDAER